MKRKLVSVLLSVSLVAAMAMGCKATVTGTRNLVRRKLNRRQTKREVTSLGILVWTERTHSL